MAKKPATLSDDLLKHRPRKGKARAQTEEKAEKRIATQVANKVATSKKIRKRRGSRTQNTTQLNIKLRPEVADRFSSLADKEDLIFGDMLEILLDAYEREGGLN